MPMKVRSIRNSSKDHWYLDRFEQNVRAQTLHNLSGVYNHPKNDSLKLNPRRFYKGKAKAKPREDSFRDQVKIDGWNSSVDVNEELISSPFGLG